MRYKIILVPFPFDDFSELKVRPAVCLTDRISPHNHIVIAFITSNFDIETEESDIKMLSSEEYFSQTGLITSSIIRLHRLVTIPINLVRRELGLLPLTLQKEVRKKLKSLFDI